MRLCILFIFLIFNGCAIKVEKIPQDFRSFKIYNSSSGEVINYQSFISSILQNDIVLLGEGHYMPYHIFLENKIIKDLMRYKIVDVVLEMGASDMQKIWDDAKMLKEHTFPKNVENVLKWDKSWKFSHYGYLVKNLFYSNANLIAGNLTKDEISQIYMGAMPLNGIKSTTNNIKEKIKNKILAVHKSSDEMINKMVEIQQFKDRRMADKLVKSKNLSILIAGRFHADKSFGVPLHIEDFDTNKKFIVVFFGYKNEKFNNEMKYENDYFIEFNEGVKW